MAISSYGASDMQQHPLPLTVLVVGFRVNQDSSPATQAPVNSNGIKKENGEMFAKRHGYLYAEIDGRTGQGTKEAYERVVEDAHTVARIRFAGDSEGFKVYRDQALKACSQLVSAYEKISRGGAQQ